MSAWIVSKENIDRVITALLILEKEHPSLPSPVPELSLIKAQEDVHGLGTQLWKINEEAVKQRYGRPYKDLPGSRVVRYEFGYSGGDPYQLIKSIHCLGYQCSKGDIPETDLYKALRKLEERFEAYLVRTDERYKNADWD